MDVVIYVRISKDADGDEHGVNTQEDICRKYCARRGLKVVAVLPDNDLSASSGVARPRYQQALDMVASGQVKGVVVRRADRFVRQPRAMEDVIDHFEKHGASLMCVEGDLDLSTPQGRMVGRMLGAAAKNEMEVKASRQRDAAAAAARKGQRRSGCNRPFGYQADHVTPDENEQAAVVSACKAVLGGSNLAEVARQWNADGLKPPQSSKWTRQGVRKVLMNPMICALPTYHGEIITLDEGATVDWKPLVTEEVWIAVKGKLEVPARTGAKGVRTLLGGLAKCRCGNTVTAMKSHHGTGIYRCNPESRTADGSHVYRKADDVEAYIEGLVILRFQQDDAADLVVTPQNVDVGALRTKAAAIRVNLDVLASDMVTGVITRSQMLAASAMANKALADIDSQIAEASKGSVLTEMIVAEHAGDTWGKLDLARQRAIISALMDITLLSTGKGSRGFDPGSVQIAWKVAA